MKIYEYLDNRNRVAIKETTTYLQSQKDGHVYPSTYALAMRSDMANIPDEKAEEWIAAHKPVGGEDDFMHQPVNTKSTRQAKAGA